MPRPSISPRSPQAAALQGLRRDLTFRLTAFCAVVVVVLLAGCSRDSGTGPVEVEWDSATCERCRMVLSDRHHSAQVRVRGSDGKSQVFVFDDIGCALVWLEDKRWRDDPATEIWVNDWRNGAWIYARTAYYLTGQATPMQYGLGAQSEAAKEALDFAAAKAQVLEAERGYEVHDGHLDAAGHRHD